MRIAAYLDGSPSQLIWISGVLLYLFCCQFFCPELGHHSLPPHHPPATLTHTPTPTSTPKHPETILYISEVEMHAIHERGKKGFSLNKSTYMHFLYPAFNSYPLDPWDLVNNRTERSAKI